MQIGSLQIPSCRDRVSRRRHNNSFVADLTSTLTRGLTFALSTGILSVWAGVLEEGAWLATFCFGSASSLHAHPCQQLQQHLVSKFCWQAASFRLSSAGHDTGTQTQYIDLTALRRRGHPATVAICRLGQQPGKRWHSASVSGSGSLFVSLGFWF